MPILPSAKNEPSIDYVEKAVSTEPKKIDMTDECAACEAFAAVFGDRLSNNKTLKIEDIDLEEICYEVKVVYKEQVIAT